jgi:hypothetical protein
MGDNHPTTYELRPLSKMSRDDAGQRTALQQMQSTDKAIRRVDGNG